MSSTIAERLQAMAQQLPATDPAREAVLEVATILTRSLADDAVVDGAEDRDLRAGLDVALRALKPGHRAVRALLKELRGGDHSHAYKLKLDEAHGVHVARSRANVGTFGTRVTPDMVLQALPDWEVLDAGATVTSDTRLRRPNGTETTFRQAFAEYKEGAFLHGKLEIVASLGAGGPATSLLPMPQADGTAPVPGPLTVASLLDGTAPVPVTKRRIQLPNYLSEHVREVPTVRIADLYRVALGLDAKATPKQIAAAVTARYAQALPKGYDNYAFPIADAEGGPPFFTHMIEHGVLALSHEVVGKDKDGKYQLRQVVPDQRDPPGANHPLGERNFTGPFTLMFDAPLDGKFPPGTQQANGYPDDNLSAWGMTELRLEKR